MTRIGLALYLVLSSAVGPSLCCCLPGELLALYTSSACHRCCDYHTTSPSHRPAKPTEAPGTPSPAPQNDCPCKESQPQPVVLTPVEWDPAAQYTRSLMVSQWATVGDSLLAAVPLTQGQAPRESISCPFRDSRDMLRALHILRC